jgi:hypothetical protein
MHPTDVVGRRGLHGEQVEALADRRDEAVDGRCAESRLEEMERAAEILALASSDFEESAQHEIAVEHTVSHIRASADFSASSIGRPQFFQRDDAGQHLQRGRRLQAPLRAM